MKHKVTVYMNDGFFQELKEASDLQQRSVSWLIEHAWRLSRDKILDYPAVVTSQDEMYVS